MRCDAPVVKNQRTNSANFLEKNQHSSVYLCDYIQHENKSLAAARRTNKRAAMSRYNQSEPSGKVSFQASTACLAHMGIIQDFPKLSGN